MVNSLNADGGGPRPEHGFDAIQTGLGMDFRDEAQKVIITITDAPSHYRGDGYGNTELTRSEVETNLQERGITYISVSPSNVDPMGSTQILAREVGGKWIDIHNADFDDILGQIVRLVIDVYILRYETDTEPGDSRDVSAEVEDPERGIDEDSGTVTVPDDIIPTLPSRFKELRAAKLDMSRQIYDISQGIDERSRIESVLDEMADELLVGDLQEDAANSTLERMIAGRDLPC